MTPGELNILIGCGVGSLIGGAFCYCLGILKERQQKRIDLLKQDERHLQELAMIAAAKDGKSLDRVVDLIVKARKEAVQ